jgi:hypothetical protein
VRLLFFALLCACSDAASESVGDRELTLVIARDELDDLESPPADAAAPTKGKKKTASKRADGPSYAEVLRARNRAKAMMYSVGLLPGDWPEIDGRMKQADKLMTDGDNAGAGALIDETTTRLESFRLTKPLVAAKLKRAERTGADKSELAAISDIVDAGKLELANERLNRVFAKRER